MAVLLVPISLWAAGTSEGTDLNAVCSEPLLVTSATDAHFSLCEVNESLCYTLDIVVRYSHSWLHLVSVSVSSLTYVDNKLIMYMNACNCYYLFFTCHDLLTRKGVTEC